MTDEIAQVIAHVDRGAVDLFPKTGGLAPLSNAGGGGNGGGRLAGSVCLVPLSLWLRLSAMAL